MKLPKREEGNLCANLLRSLLAWAQRSSCSGVSKATKSDRLVTRIFYSLVVLALMIFFSINIINVLRVFYRYNTISQIQTVRLSHFQFPTVTVCNSNLLQPARAGSYLRNFQQSDAYKEWTYLRNSFSPREYFALGRNLYMVTINQSIALEYGYTLNDMLLSCYFNSKECQKSDFEYYYSTRYGNCYRFNSPATGPLRESGVSGALNGLQLELFTGFEEGNFTNFGRVGGAHVFINNYTVDPLENEGFDIANGLQTSIVLDVVHEERLNYPFSNCVFNLKANDSAPSVYYRNTMAQKNFYSRGYCLLLCYQNRIVNTCGCNDPQAPIDPAYKQCNTINETICFMDASTNFYVRGGPIVECLNDCPVECETYHFHSSSFVADFPSVEYATAMINYRNFTSILPPNLTDFDTLKRSILSLNVYYSDIGYTLYREQPAKSIEQLTSDIGKLHLGHEHSKALLGPISFSLFLKAATWHCVWE